jgi:hypothetical protein
LIQHWLKCRLEAFPYWYPNAALSIEPQVSCWYALKVLCMCMCMCCASVCLSHKQTRQKGGQRWISGIFSCSEVCGYIFPRTSKCGKFLASKQVTGVICEFEKEANKETNSEKQITQTKQILSISTYHQRKSHQRLDSSIIASQPSARSPKSLPFLHSSSLTNTKSHLKPEREVKQEAESQDATAF